MAESLCCSRVFIQLCVYLFLIGNLFHFTQAINKENTNHDPCILKTGDTTLNLNILKNPNGYEVIHENRKFLINICDKIQRYSQQNITATEIDIRTGNIKQVLGYLHYLSILTSYKPIPALKYQTAGRKKNRNVVEIQFKCNQRLRQHKISLVTPQAGRKYKFLFESNMVCNDQKMNCVVQQKHNNIQYDLSSLYKLNSNWQVANTTEKILLNICGPLNDIPSKRNRECSYKDTQVCLVDKNNVSKNLGLLTTDFSINSNDILTITFKDGSSCNNTTIETTIDFYCAVKEQNPQLLMASFCKYHIIWNTPAACPNFVSSGLNCQIYDPFFGSRDMRTIFPETDTTKQINNDISIAYNLCNTLFTPCSFFNNASVCLFYKDTETVLGWTNNKIESTNGRMTMRLFGDICLTNTGQISSVNVNYLCSSDKKSYDVINLSSDMCNVDINIYTHLACVENNDYSECFLNVNNQKYDLRPLVSNLSNYEVQDPKDRNIKYLVNICRPLIFKNDVFCNRYSSVCLKNLSEPNLTKRFKSLGSFTILSVPFIENNNLMIRYHSGICNLQNVTHNSIFTDINFICDRLEQKPILKYNDGCQFIFEWRTRHACPKKP